MQIFVDSVWSLALIGLFGQLVILCGCGFLVVFYLASALWLSLSMRMMKYGFASLRYQSASNLFFASDDFVFWFHG